MTKRRGRRRRPTARRGPSAAAMRHELKALLAQAQALVVAAGEQLAAARAVRHELQGDLEASRHAPVLLAEDGRVH